MSKNSNCVRTHIVTTKCEKSEILMKHKLWWNCEETKMVISTSIDKSQTVRNHKYYKTQVLTNTNYDKTQIVTKHKIMTKNRLCQNTIFYQKNVTNSKCDSTQIMTQLKLWQNSNWDNN